MKGKAIQKTQISSPPSFGKSLTLTMKRLETIKKLLYPIENPPSNGDIPDYLSILEEIFPLVGEIEETLAVLLGKILLDGYDAVLSEEEHLSMKKERM